MAGSIVHADPAGNIGHLTDADCRRAAAGCAPPD
jgi:hypothetical protein